MRQGHPEFVPKLIESIADVIEDELVVWISENGGWASFPSFLLKFAISFEKSPLYIKAGLNIHVQPETSEFSLIESTCLGLAGAVAVLVLFYMLRFIAFGLISRMGFS